jgi:hypothetical protein
MTDEPVLTLFSSCLLSKFGFGDGDQPDHWLDWCDEQGIDYSAWDWGWRPVLRRLVREHLVPKLDQRVEGTLTPDHVDVPYSEVLRIAREVAALTGSAAP